MLKIGKIDYLNLLPFDIYLKKSSLSFQQKKMITYRKSYPAKLNSDFLFSRLDGGFVSSIMALGKKNITTNIGIIAKGEVWSVIVLPKENQDDYQSATSNALAKVLKVSGEVRIGDRALHYKIQGGEYQDLGLLWWKKHRLPFVFGLFCLKKRSEKIQSMLEGFSRTKPKIPYYILIQSSYSSKIPPKEIRAYLQKIYYALKSKEKRALEHFHRELRILGIKKPKRIE
ncbi:menaquinone biosynthesis protein [Helicobacter cholecystus]|uniref:Chorismate dehydratase n=1 Tax=Helicobacter cholecystus TaxID=45498 RepID=A0A3D8IXH5_9HELI|nr:MqnA/MqnD/SBP family protein [Helicobacter cholecystus]RDU69962.1 menaquinone biosynthesis protein [Helicobacter cholecystus]VEJ24871.1 ACR protein [Helicobacter cholecystus]